MPSSPNYKRDLTQEYKTAKDRGPQFSSEYCWYRTSERATPFPCFQAWRTTSRGGGWPKES